MIENQSNSYIYKIWFVIVFIKMYSMWMAKYIKESEKIVFGFVGLFDKNEKANNSRKDLLWLNSKGNAINWKLNYADTKICPFFVWNYQRSFWVFISSNKIAIAWITKSYLKSHKLNLNIQNVEFRNDVNGWISIKLYNM